jgi:tetratricopeptide (TPR) repeat protein
MTKRFFCALLVGICLLAACNRDPNVAKKRYVENGNKYFEKGKYKEAVIMYRNALKRDAKYGEAYYRAALAELRLQRYGEAVRDLQRAVELQPENLDALNRLSNLYLNAYLADRKRSKPLLSELTALHDRYLKRFPNTYEEARLKGYLNVFENDVPAALVSFEKANRLKPYQPELVLVLMQTLAASNRIDEAVKLAWETIEKKPDATPVYDALVIHNAKQNNAGEVERILKLKAEKNPKLSDPPIQLAGHYYTTKNREAMMASLERLLGNQKDFPKAHSMVGDFFLRIREYDLAAQHYRKGLQADEKEKAWYNKRLVEVLVRQNKKDEAFALIGEVLKQHPNDDEAIAIRASLSMLAGTRDQIQSAINDLQTVVTRTPQNFVARYNLGRALLARGSWEAAKVQFEESIKLRPDYIPPRLLLAQVLLQNRDFGKAVQMVKETLDYDPNNVPARLLRTRALIGLGELKQARTELNQATQQFPELPEARLQIAALDLRERNFKSAEEGFRKLHTQFNDPRALMGLVDSFVGQGQHATALKLLRDELAKNPERSDYRMALANIAMR